MFFLFEKRLSKRVQKGIFKTIGKSLRLCNTQDKNHTEGTTHQLRLSSGINPPFSTGFKSETELNKKKPCLVLEICVSTEAHAKR